MQDDLIPEQRKRQLENLIPRAAHLLVDHHPSDAQDRMVQENGLDPLDAAYVIEQAQARTEATKGGRDADQTDE
jgi:hypothetical protein